MRLMLSILMIAFAMAVQAQAPIKWECEFRTASTYAGDGEKERNPDKFVVSKQPLSLTFLEADQKAFVLGNAGAAEVALLRTDRGGLQFIERTGSDALQVTALDAFGNATHSRHTVNFDGQLLAAQHYGKCKKLP